MDGGCPLSQSKIGAVVALFLFLLPAPVLAQKVSIRLNFAVVNSLSMGEKVNDELKTLLLQTIAKYFGTDAGWSVTPSSANTSGLDGITLQTPPLSSEEIQTKLAPALDGIKKIKRLAKGIRSTTAITVSLSSEEYSTRLKRVLFIENHWPEIYRSLAPLRFGTGTIEDLVEWPIAVDSPLLLQDLRNSPGDQSSVKALFKKHELKESPWNKRPADYTGYLGIDQAPSPAITFRIPDLVYSGKDLVKVTDFFTALATVPSPNLDGSPRARPLTPPELEPDAIALQIEKAQSPQEHQRFLQILRIDEKTYGFDRADRHWNRAGRIAIVDPFSPLAPYFEATSTSEPITFGFEAEFEAEERYLRLLKPNRSTMIDTNSYPFLAPKIEEEDSGNKEVRSIGGETTLAEIEHQMKLVKSILSLELKGFHFRLRVPKAVIDRVPSDKFTAWMGLVADAIMAWRIENRQTKYGLKTYSQRRFELAEPDNRSTIRVLQVEGGKFVDIEIRGFMTDIRRIISTARHIIAGLREPGLIPTNLAEQAAVRFSEKSESLTDWMERFSQTFQKRPLTAGERKVARALSEDLKISYEEEGGGIYQGQELPLFHFERLGFLTPLERQRIGHANLEFAKQAWNVIQRKISGEYEGQKEADVQYRDRIRRWAQAVRLHDVLTSSLLIRSSDCRAMEAL